MTQTRLWSRPLAPLVAALAAGIAAPSLGLAFPSAWLAFPVVALLLLLAVCFWRDLPLAWVGCLLFFCLGQGLYHTALNPDLPAHHVRFLPQNTPISLLGVVQSRPLPSLAGEIAGWNWPPPPGQTALPGSLPAARSG